MQRDIFRNLPMTELKPTEVTTLHLYDLAHSIPPSPLTQLYTSFFSNNIAEKSLNLPTSLDYKICTNCGMLLLPGLTMKLRVKYPKKNKSRHLKASTKIKKIINKIGNKSLIELGESLDDKSTLEKLISKSKEYNQLHSELVRYNDLLNKENGKLQKLAPRRSPPTVTGLSLPMLLAPTLKFTPEPTQNQRFLQITCMKCKFSFKQTNLIQQSDKVKELVVFKANWDEKNSNTVTKTLKAKNRLKFRKQNNLSTLLNNKKKEKEKSGINSLQLMDFLGN